MGTRVPRTSSHVVMCTVVVTAEMKELKAENVIDNRTDQKFLQIFRFCTRLTAMTGLYHINTTKPKYSPVHMYNNSASTDLRLISSKLYAGKLVVFILTVMCS